ncbi:FAS1-like dehydratase domain-containing protein [Microbacterium gorillae]|uniref:FAS1-like dehydratase domain-containing protein n=1 Tax=Microbacterium gorillae TaxID=1231063 RepID=UPI00058D605C|nr:MaoC family dehydratase N-terminal domain-containing protein [Microbacterium gorillae]
MSVDPALIGYAPADSTARIDRERVAFFARTIGIDSGPSVDLDAAVSDGHPDLVVPPTMLFGVELERSDTFAVYAAHGAPLSKILHGEQRFVYHADVHAGEELTFRSVVTDVFEKAGGKLEFILRRTDVLRDGQLVAELHNTGIVRH